MFLRLCSRAPEMTSLSAHSSRTSDCADAPVGLRYARDDRCGSRLSASRCAGGRSSARRRPPRSVDSSPAASRRRDAGRRRAPRPTGAPRTGACSGAPDPWPTHSVGRATQLAAGRRRRRAMPRPKATRSSSVHRPRRKLELRALDAGRPRHAGRRRRRPAPACQRRPRPAPSTAAAPRRERLGARCGRSNASSAARPRRPAARPAARRPPPRGTGRAPPGILGRRRHRRRAHEIWSAVGSEQRVTSAL